MEKSLRLSDDKINVENRRANLSLNSNVTVERIEKLKKTFQPFWMRGMLPHQIEDEKALDTVKAFNQI